MKICNITNLRKLASQRQRRNSHGVVWINTPWVEDKFILSSQKLKKPMASFKYAPKLKNAHPVNLTNELQRIKYNRKELEYLLATNPHLSRTVGSLPKKWGAKVGNNPLYREGIEHTFAEFSRNFTRRGESQKDIDFLETKLSLILDSDIKMTFLGQGSWGKTFKITDGKDAYVLKVFYANHNLFGLIADKSIHGNIPELTSAVYSSKHEAGRYAKFYMGRFGEKDDGYILTKFVPETTRKNKIINGMEENFPQNFVFSEKLRRVRNEDFSGGNELGKRVVDFGAIMKTSAYNLDSKSLRIAKLLGRGIDTNNEKLIDRTIEKYGHTKEYKNAVGFMQHLINTECTELNYDVLRRKEKLLAKLDIDTVPDIRFILAQDKNYASKHYMDKSFDKMYNIPLEAFEKLWEKYHEIAMKLINN